MFPAGIASGNDFYDRTEERKRLIDAIQTGRHTALIAPRKFGKTSLMKKVIEDQRYPFIWIDFMTFTSKEETESKFLVHISDLVVKIGKSEKKIRNFIQKHLSALQPEIRIGASSLLSIHFHPTSPKKESLIPALAGLDAIAQDLDQRIVIICDEFQEITHIDSGNTLQASIRHAAERAKKTTYLFSGSKHQSLRRLLNGKQNPLYELCDQMPLTLIEKSYYHDYLKQESNQKWGEALPIKCIDMILQHTKCYPKYVNALCAKLWLEVNLPSEETIELTWKDYIYTRKAGIREEIDSLSLNELKLFKTLCKNPTQKPFSKDFLIIADLSQSNIKRALDQLQEKDLICFFNDKYQPIDPTYQYYFDMFG